MTEHILVLGGGGFIGSHACKSLGQAGFTPVVYDNFSTGFRDAVRFGPVEEGDIADSARVAAVAARYGIKAAMHFAGSIAVGESVARPDKYYRNNVAATLNLLDGLRAGGVGRVIFSSSAAVYGMPETLPIPEGHPTRPTSPYGHSKLMVEQILADYCAAFGLASCSLRYFNAAGADPQGELGERHDPETHLIPLVLAAALGERPSIRIFGTDYATADGTCLRDYVHVADLADAHVLALRWLGERSEPAAEMFNLGIGQGFSVREVIEAARRVTGRAIPVEEAARRPGDPAVLVADGAKARRVLGWNPRFPELETQVAHAWAWHHSRADGAVSVQGG